MVLQYFRFVQYLPTDLIGLLFYRTLNAFGT